MGTTETDHALTARGWRCDGCMSPAYRSVRGYPPRQAVRYTEAEDRDLIAQFKAGSRIEDIAEWHQRGVAGVCVRLARLGLIGDRPLPNDIIGFAAAQSAMRASRLIHRGN